MRKLAIGVNKPLPLRVGCCEVNCKPKFYANNSKQFNEELFELVTLYGGYVGLINFCGKNYYCRKN
jgi:hypothetical protein